MPFSAHQSVVTFNRCRGDDIAYNMSTRECAADDHRKQMEAVLMLCFYIQQLCRGLPPLKCPSYLVMMVRFHHYWCQQLASHDENKTKNRSWGKRKKGFANNKYTHTTITATSNQPPFFSFLLCAPLFYFPYWLGARLCMRMRISAFAVRGTSDNNKTTYLKKNVVNIARCMHSLLINYWATPLPV